MQMQHENPLFGYTQKEEMNLVVMGRHRHLRIARFFLALDA